MAKCKKLICFALLCAIAVSAVQATAVAQEQITIHMSLSGTEQGDGSKEKPVNTFASALRLVRSKYVKEDEVTIEIEGGVYETKSTINLNEETLDRFDGQLNIKARDGEEVWFSGSTKIDINDFKPVTDPEIIKRLPKESVSNIGVLDLTRYGFTKETLHPTYDKTTYYSGVNYLDLRLNERKESIARYPNTGTVPYGKIIRKEVPDSFPDRVDEKIPSPAWS